ncbi:MAG: carboxypeptidase-like regulatory domain-containing protein, partial [Pedobacter agri]
MQIFTADNGIAIFRRPQILVLSFLISFLFFICSSLTILAQTTPLINSKLVGKVVEEKSKDAIPGAIVHIKGTTHSVSTDSKGRFEFVTGQKFPYTLEVSYVGYEKVEVIADGSALTVALKESSSSLNEVVVVGYGTQQKANLTGAVATLDFKDIE